MAADKIQHIVLSGDTEPTAAKAIEYALVYRSPSHNEVNGRRTRITVITERLVDVHDFVFDYQELFDNSYWRIVDLGAPTPKVDTRRPQYEGRRADFVDVEWEFVVGRISNPIVQAKLTRWARDPKQQLTVALCYDNPARNEGYARRLGRRLPPEVKIEIHNPDPEAEAKRKAELMEMAKYLHYFYRVSSEMEHVPTELPGEEVDKAWEALDPTMKMSNICNVMSIPYKMALLGHDRTDWDTFYALTADEIERLTAIEHNRWCVERLIQGSRPCTDEERREVAADMRLRLTDRQYALANPISLKKRYKTERNAHYDLCAFSELGVDETGLPVTRYDRDLTAAIPLIVKTYHDRRVAESER